MDARRWQSVTRSTLLERGPRNLVIEELHSHTQFVALRPQRLDMRDTAGEAPFRHVLAYDYTGHSQMHLNHSTLRQLAIRGEVNPVIADIHGGGSAFRVCSLPYGAQPQWECQNQAPSSRGPR